MRSHSDGNSRAPRNLVIAAFAAIYLIWGSTYLGIRFAVETIPPFLMGGMRFFFAGVALYGVLRLRGASKPTLSQWQHAMIVGGLLLGIGNGAVNWAEKTIPSGVVALLIAIVPIWFALLEWLRPGGKPPSWGTVIGIVVGTMGVVWLVISREGWGHGTIEAAGIGAVLLAGIAWATGSLYAKYAKLSDTGLLGVSLQMIAGGTCLLLTGLVLGEADEFKLHAISQRSALALAYLTLVGSLIGFTAYVWLLKVSTPSRISSYAYVNPAIAVFLGWALAGEQLTMGMLWASAVILAGVVIITQSK